MNPRVLGPRLGGQVQQVIRAVKAGSWTQAGDRVEAAGVVLEPGEYELKLAAADPDSTSALPGNTGLIALDLRVTPELAAEGTARDVVRIVQQARRDAGLAVSDRIRLDDRRRRRGRRRGPGARRVRRGRDARGGPGGPAGRRGRRRAAPGGAATAVGRDRGASPRTSLTYRPGRRPGGGRPPARTAWPAAGGG